MSFAWGCYAGLKLFDHDRGGSKSSKKRRRTSRHRLVHSAGGTRHRHKDSALDLCERLKEVLEACQTSSNAKQRLKERSKLLMPLLRQIESILLEETEARSSEQETDLVHTYPKLIALTSEQLAVQITKKEEEIRLLKEQCGRKTQQIQQLEEQKYHDREQAKEFEVNYRVEAEENQLLRTENEELKNQLDSGFVCGSDDGSDLVTGAEDDGVKRTVTGLKARVRELNEDVAKLRNHSKEQSRQILKYKQQVEVSDMMERQLESMERIQHEAKEECRQMHNELKSTTQELCRLRDEKDVMERERDQLERNLISMSDLSSQLMECERATSQLKQQLDDKKSEIIMLKSQLAANRKDRPQVREVPVRAGAQSNNSEWELIGDYVEEEVKVKKESDEGELQQRYQTICKQLEEHRESLSVLEQDNTSLKQEIGARSSQVKQYAKEVDRLKRQLEALSLSTQEVTNTDHEQSQINLSQMEDLYKKAQETIESLSGENVRCHKLLERLEKENTQLKGLIQKQGFLSPPSTMSGSEEGCVHTLKPQSKVKSQLQDQANMLHPVSPLIGEKRSTPGAVLTATNFDVVECDSPNIRREKHTYENQTIPPLPPSNSSTSSQQKAENEARSSLENSLTLFENPLQRELDDEIHSQAAQVIQQVSGNRREGNTDPKRPFDPNLVCPMCRKQFRIGEIQRFRRHVNTCTGTNDD